MIDIIKAEKAFKEYLKQYDVEDPKVKLKLTHTYGVVDVSEYLANELKLDEENKNLAKLIALLHDIGRFEQSKMSKDIYDKADTEFFDHAEYGIKILFEDNLIRNFVEEKTYDSIIYKSILNHNKLEIDKGLTKEELLYAQIIRDADKIDNYRVKLTESFKVLLGTDDENAIYNDVISDKIFKCFMSQKLVDIKENKTYLDRWTGYMAFVFDLNFSASFKYLKENDSVNKCFNRIKYNNIDTKIKVNSMQNLVESYIEKHI